MWRIARLLGNADSLSWKSCYFVWYVIWVDKNRMTRDFMVLFEMYAPQLETIWTTPQKYIDCDEVIALIAMIVWAGCSA